MRLDKYLKVSRIIKRRTIAKDVSDLGLVKIGGKEAKPSTEVKIGDILELTLGERILKVRVLDVKNVVGKKNAAEMFEILSDQVIDPTSLS